MMIGIDFGTTNSSVAIYRPTGAEIIETVDGDEFMPSTVAVTEDGLITGKPANHQLLRNPEYTFRNIKRYLGLDYNEQEHGSIHLAEGPDGKVWWRGRGDTLLSGPILVAEVLKSLLLAAEIRLGRKPLSAVIAVPVDFRDPQKEAIHEAGAIAGLKKVHLFEEPYCAALSYGLREAAYEQVLVYDFGGGTFDATVLKIKRGDSKALGMSGSAQLGGADFDKRLADFAIDKFFEREGEDLRAYPKQVVRIQHAAEEAKKILSRMEHVEINEPSVAFPKSGLASLKQEVSRGEFEDMTRDLVVRTIASVNDALVQAKVPQDKIDKVLLVGGQSRMPMIRAVMAEMFGERKIVKDGPRAEQAVVLGAAIRAAQLDGRLKEKVMQRLVPSSVGVRVNGGAFHAFIPRGAVFPIRAERELKPTEEDQADMELIVLQGEDPGAAGNTEVCRLVLPARRAATMIDINDEGRLLVWVDDEIRYGHVEEEEAA